MNKFLKHASILPLLVIGINSVNAATITGNSSAVVMVPISAVENTPLNFGTVAGDSAGASSVIVSSAGVASAGTGSPFIGAGAAAGAFTITGDTTNTVNIDVSASTASLTGPGTAMTASSFTTDVPSVTLVGGTGTFNVGATLALGASQGAGTYNGTYTMVLNY